MVLARGLMLPVPGMILLALLDMEFLRIRFVELGVDRSCSLVAHCVVWCWSRPADVASADDATANRAVQSISCTEGTRKASLWCAIARGASGVLIVRRSGYRSYRCAAVACRSSVEGMWLREVARFLVLLSSQRLQLKGMVRHDFAQWLMVAYCCCCRHCCSLIRRWEDSRAQWGCSPLPGSTCSTALRAAERVSTLTAIYLAS